jgi:DNA-binding transcriptional LysR family regulator
MLDHDIVNNIRKFWLLKTIIEAGSFREAAALARVTQSALSQTVSHLEGLTGRVLLERQKGRVLPTVHGRELLTRVRPILDAIDDVSRASQGSPPMTWLGFGAYDSFAVEFVPELVTRLQVKCPGLRLSLRVSRSGALATLVRKGELCMAVIRELDELGRLDVFEIATDRLGFWAAPSHPAVDQGWAGLPEHEIGTIAADADGHPRYLKRLVDAAALTRRPMFVSDSFASLLAAATCGALVSVLPERMVQASGARLVEIVPPDGATALGAHRVLLISRQGCDPRENEFLAAELREVMGEPAEACAAATCASRSAALV